LLLEQLKEMHDMDAIVDNDPEIYKHVATNWREGIRAVRFMYGAG